jgi:hypothetical protein
MKSFIPLLIIVLLKLSVSGQNLDIMWQQCYGGSEEELVYDATVINDKLYIVGATKSQDGDVSFNHGTADAWLIVTDTLGNIIWEKTYGGSNGDWFAKILPTDNNTIYLLGSTASSDGDISYDPYPGSRDIWVVKIDILGNILWEKVIGGGMIDNVESGALASDGGVVVFGWTGSQNGEVSINYGMYDMWLVKLNSDGDIEWEKSFGTDDFDYGTAIISTSDGGFLLGGTSTIGRGGNLTCIPFNLNAEAIILKLDSTGNIEWQNCYGGSGHDAIWGIQELIDGYILVGIGSSGDGDLTGSGWHGMSDIWVIKIDFYGNIIWQRCYGGSRFESALNIFSTTDNHFVIIGATQSQDGDITNNHSIMESNYDIWVLKINNVGDIITQKCFGGVGNDFILSGTLQKSDNNYVIAAYTNYGPSFDVGCTPYGGNGDIDYWVFEIMLDDTVNVITPVASTREIRVYPNPATTETWLHLPENITLEKARVELYSPTGRLLCKAQPTSYFHKIETANLPKGLYLVRVWNGERWMVVKLVVR